MNRPHLFRRFQNSMRGITTAWKLDSAFRVRLALGIAAILLGAYVQLPLATFYILLLATCAMLSAEIANTALEEVCNVMQPQFDMRIRAIKDMQSATVFVAAMPLIAIVVLEITPRLL